jgi:hypothetical protein
VQRQYDYRPKWITIILCGIFFGACAFVLGATARSNVRGLSFNGMIELSASGATVFYWVLTLLSIGFVVLAGCLAMVRLTLHQRITLTDTSITIPRSRWSKEEIVLSFGEINELSRSEVSGQRFLGITYNGGKLSVAAAMLPTNDDFEQICAAVSHGVKASRAYKR